MTRLLLVSIFAATFSACSGSGHDHSSHDHGSHSYDTGAAAKPYKLAQCVVSNEPLGDRPKRIVYQGQEVKFCCPDCIKDFNKDPQKYLKMIAARQ